MRTSILAIVALTSGCDHAFGLTRDKTVVELDAAPDAPPDAYVCTVMKAQLPLVADAEMISTAGAQDQGHGLESILNIGTSISSEGILRFDVSQLPPAPTSFTLTLPVVQRALACGTGCTLCTLDHAGILAVSFLRSDWIEATVSYAKRGTGLMWATVGALGSADRSLPLVTAPIIGAGDVTLTFPATGYLAWIAANRLSLVVSPSASAVRLTKQLQWTDGCLPDPAFPSLTVEYCQ